MATNADKSIIGFTGTRRGLSNAQRNKLKDLLSEHQFNYKILTAHHGDCIGADAEFHSILDNRRRSGAVVPYLRFHLHPCIPDKQRAYCHTDSRYDKIELPLPPLVRNREIVDSVGYMFCCPNEMEEQRRGGTWSTIRYARDENREGIIIYPDGSIEFLIRERIYVIKEPLEMSLLSN
jgi:hypothetical protein